MNRFWYSLGEKQKLVLVAFECICETMNQSVRRVVTEIHRAGLYSTQVGVTDADQRRKLSQTQLLGMTELANTISKCHNEPSLPTNLVDPSPPTS